MSVSAKNETLECSKIHRVKRSSVQTTSDQETSFGMLFEDILFFTMENVHTERFIQKLENKDFKSMRMIIDLSPGF